jgi:Uma2 family endonuclease
MTTLLIQTENTPLTVNFPAIVKMTQAQFYEFCQANQELRIERTAQGEVIIMPPAFSDTGNRNFNIAAQLGVWTEQNGAGIGFDSSAGFTLPNGATRSPDASWIKLERWNALTAAEQASFAPICPDFVIELRSASDTLISLQTKMQEYIDNGASLGWLIDCKNRQVYIYRPDRSPEVLEQPELVTGDPELPGFRLQMAKIW